MTRSESIEESIILLEICPKNLGGGYSDNYFLLSDESRKQVLDTLRKVLSESVEGEV